MDNLQLYMKSLKEYKEYDEKDTHILLNHVHKTKEGLVQGNLYLIAKIAIDMHTFWPDLDVMDYIQEGNETLIKVIDKFDPTRGVKFSTFLSYCVKKQILRYVKDNVGAVRLYNSRAQRAVFQNLEEIKAELSKGIDPNVLAEMFNVDTHTIDTVLQSQERGELDTGRVDSPEEVYIKNESCEIVCRKIAEFRRKLDEVELLVFDEVMYEGTTTLPKLATHLDMHRQRLWRIKEGIIEKARKHFTIDDLKSIMR